MGKPSPPLATKAEVVIRRQSTATTQPLQECRRALLARLVTKVHGPSNDISLGPVPWTSPLDQSLGPGAGLEQPPQSVSGYGQHRLIDALTLGIPAFNAQFFGLKVESRKAVLAGGVGGVPIRQHRS